jgi:hypothetical protein
MADGRCCRQRRYRATTRAPRCLWHEVCVDAGLDNTQYVLIHNTNTIRIIHNTAGPKLYYLVLFTVFNTMIYVFHPYFPTQARNQPTQARTQPTQARNQPTQARNQPTQARNRPHHSTSSLNLITQPHHSTSSLNLITQSSAAQHCAVAVRWLCAMDVRWLCDGCAMAVRWLCDGCTMAARWGCAMAA